MLPTANNSIIFHVQSSKLLTLAHRDHDKLLKFKNYDPNIYEEFKKGCFSLK